MSQKTIKTALISVFDKGGLDSILPLLKKHNIQVLSTGGTYNFLSDKELRLSKVEDLTAYPSILDGRVKTLHPKVFGGILARRIEAHREELSNYNIPEIDLVIVDLYPFEKTVEQSEDHQAIIEKIDIGGISLIRAAAKNYQDVVVIPSKQHYSSLASILEHPSPSTTLEERRALASAAFSISSSYDAAIRNYIIDEPLPAIQLDKSNVLRYGENPHQQGIFFGEMESMFNKLSGKALSYNNLVDVDAAINLMKEFADEGPTCAILKHTNACGVAQGKTLLESWERALAADNVSAFGGIFIFNQELDLSTAEAIDKLFYEVVIAPGFSPEAKNHLAKKSKRILLKLNHYNKGVKSVKTILNGYIEQDIDLTLEEGKDFKIATKQHPTAEQSEDLVFALKCAKHLKSNTIVFARNKQLLGMGCGQTSRVDACKQAIAKAESFGFDLKESVMASDAFFPFPDCVELAAAAGTKAIIQPGGSIKDQLSIDACDKHDIAMVMTGVRHFKH